MAQKTKTLEIVLVDNGGTFNSFFKRFTGEGKDLDFESLGILRKLLSNEKARLLHVIKAQNPRSIYELAKYLKRDFKAVSDDVKLLERFGFIEMVSETTGKRERLKPVLTIDSINITIKV